MAQITVPGSTAESTNVTPVSAEVPTGVTLPCLRGGAHRRDAS